MLTFLLNKEEKHYIYSLSYKQQIPTKMDMITINKESVDSVAVVSILFWKLFLFYYVSILFISTLISNNQ